MTSLQRQKPEKIRDFVRTHRHQGYDHELVAQAQVHLFGDDDVNADPIRYYLFANVLPCGITHLIIQSTSQISSLNNEFKKCITKRYRIPVLIVYQSFGNQNAVIKMINECFRQKSRAKVAVLMDDDHVNSVAQQLTEKSTMEFKFCGGNETMKGNGNMMECLTTPVRDAKLDKTRFSLDVRNITTRTTPEDPDVWVHLPQNLPKPTGRHWTSQNISAGDSLLSRWGKRR